MVFSNHNVIVGNFSLEHEQKVKPKRQKNYGFKDPIGKENVFFSEDKSNKRKLSPDDSKTWAEQTSS